MLVIIADSIFFNCNVIFLLDMFFKSSLLILPNICLELGFLLVSPSTFTVPTNWSLG